MQHRPVSTTIVNQKCIASFEKQQTHPILICIVLTLHFTDNKHTASFFFLCYASQTVVYIELTYKMINSKLIMLQKKQQKQQEQLSAASSSSLGAGAGAKLISVSAVQQRSALGRASNTISILSKSDAPLVIDKSSVIVKAEAAHLVQPSTSTTTMQAASHNLTNNNNNNNNNNNSPMMSSRTSRNSRASYNSIASTLRFKANRVIVNAEKSGSFKKPETFFEDPLYKAKQLKKQRRQDIAKRFNDPIVNPAKPKAKTKQAYESVKDATGGDYKIARCNLTFIFDPNGRLSYYMSKSTIDFSLNFLLLVALFVLHEKLGIFF
jgi:hypothetical protein